MRIDRIYTITRFSFQFFEKWSFLRETIFNSYICMCVYITWVLTYNQSHYLLHLNSVHLIRVTLTSRFILQRENATNYRVRNMVWCKWLEGCLATKPLTAAKWDINWSAGTIELAGPPDPGLVPNPSANKAVSVLLFH